jgi:arylsulfatase
MNTQRQPESPARSKRISSWLPNPAIWLAASLLLLVCLGSVNFAFGESKARGPNIIFIITDDQGYGDLSCHGNPILKTPNIDRLFAEGVRFNNYHVSPTCAPTRSAIMSGKHEFRNGVTHTIHERERLNLKTFTFPQALRAAGYTNGIFGKWHLGDQPEYQPENRGFHEAFIHGAGGIGQSYPGSCGDAPGNSYFNPVISHNGKFVKTKGYCTDVFFSQAMSWIEQQKERGPFYCHISPNCPHAPLDCPPDYEKQYADKVKPNEAKFFGMIANIDDNVGRLMAKLKEWKIDENTLVIFTTDNGGTAGTRIFNAGMRGTKGTPWVGGTRVPCIWRWPGRLIPGDVHALVAHVDLFPTFTELTQATVPPEVKTQLEGRSLIPLLTNHRADWADRNLVTHVGRWERGQAEAAKFKQCSIRNSRFQMVSLSKNGQPAWELFDLEQDPGEEQNVIGEHPEVAKELQTKYDAWWASLQPDLVNEDAPIPAANAFKTRYWEQFPDEQRPKK